MAVTLLGVTVAGTAVPFSPAYCAAEFESYFRETNLDAILVSKDESGPCLDAAERLGLGLLRIAEDGSLLDRTASRCELSLPDPNDIALVLLTSGSTGRAKSVPLTHRNLCTSAGDVIRSVDLSADDLCLAMWEQYHIGGLVDLLLAPLASGGTVFITGGFNAGEFFALLLSENPTWFQGVPTTLNELAFHASRNALIPKPNSLRCIRSVAAALSPNLKCRIEELFGVPVIQTFGMTEAGPLITSTRLNSARSKPSSVGLPCGPEVMIMGPRREILAPGVTGEVAVRGDNVFSGYENDPTSNQSQFYNGWFYTGDLGYRDSDGELFLTGRIKQLINRGGEKVNPQEVDDALLCHPAISEAAAFPVNHRTLGEDVVAAVVLRSPAHVVEIRNFLSSRLSSFKIPGHIEILDRLPRNVIGKVERSTLRENYETANRHRNSNGAPGNELETFLAKIWAAELDTESPGIHDHFAELGGDSLSSLRIVIAVEKALSIKIRERFYAGLTTIAAMATRLKAHGILEDGTVRGLISESITDLSKIDAKSLLSRVDLGISGAEGDLEAAYGKLMSCVTKQDIRIIGDSITLYSTPKDLRTLLTRNRNSKPAKSGLCLLRLPTTWRATYERLCWHRKIRRGLAGALPGSDSWKQTRLENHVFLFVNPEVPNHGKTLIVGFCDNAMRLMMPLYCLLTNLDSARYDLLILRDPKREHFANGVESVSDDLDSTATYLDSYMRSNHYLRALTFGASAGGLASICVARINGWSRAVTVGADNPSRHPIIAAKLNDLAFSDLSPRTEIHLNYSINNKRDREAGESIHQLFPSSILMPDRRFSAHNLLHKLYRNGELKNFLAKQFQEG